MNIIGTPLAQVISEPKAFTNNPYFIRRLDERSCTQLYAKATQGFELETVLIRTCPDKDRRNDGKAEQYDQEEKR